VDEHSIKVEGNGAAIITDIAVESLPNRELFEDRYPDSDSDAEDLDLEDDVETQLTDDELAKKYPEVREAMDRLTSIQDELEKIQELTDSANKRLVILDAYNNTLDDKNGRPIEESIAVYKQEREKGFQERIESQKKERELRIELNSAIKDLRIITTRKASEWKKAGKAKAKEILRKKRLKEERNKEKLRIKKERLSFWPKYCYSVRISLDVSAFTPVSSRRASMSSDIDVAKPLDPAEDKGSAVPLTTCDLTLSYVTTSAYWAPNYDLQLSTTDSTASLCFDAQINNSTSETWEDCKVTLSTSQANFAGLEDAIPTLEPWHIKLVPKSSGTIDGDVLESHEEISHRQAHIQQQRTANVPKPRSEMFGVSNPDELKTNQNGVSAGSNVALQDYQMQLMLLEQQNKKRLMMARQENDTPGPPPRGDQIMTATYVPSGGPMRALERRPASAGMPMRPQMLRSALMNMNAQGPPPPPAPSAPGGTTDALQEFDFDSFLNSGGEPHDFNGTIAWEQEPLDFQESLVEETGFTTSYDLPGLKTLVPKSTASKQRVARISFAKVTFSHTAVPKYKPVAFLKAKLRNNSKLTLLRGPTGLTLDGSFMGRTTLPRCSAGDAFTLSLGVDPAIRVVYPKPEVRRTTTGVFTKEDSSVYVRTMTLHNTRASHGQPIKLLVLDQVPVSEDERLKVPLITPRGLTVDGGAVAAGAPGSTHASDKNWGIAEARLEKGGQVSWVVSLNAGKTVKLALEYAVAMPSGEHAMQCS
jgi:hypothetical protein